MVDLWLMYRSTASDQVLLILVNLKDIDRIETVSTKESIEKSKSLARQYGLFIGFSAAANFLVAERLIEEGYGKNIVTILCDRGERYFSCL